MHSGVLWLRQPARRLVVLGLGLLLILSGVLVGLVTQGVLAIHDDPNTVHVCYNPISRVARVVDNPEGNPPNGCAWYEEEIDLAGIGAVTAIQRVAGTTQTVGPKAVDVDTVACPGTGVATGGGVVVSNNLAMNVIEDFPQDNVGGDGVPDAWTGTVENLHWTDNGTYTVYVNCIGS